MCSEVEISCAKRGIFARFQFLSNTTHGAQARIQRKWVIFPRHLVRRIGIDLYYLNRSDFPHSDVLSGSPGLVIHESGLPPTCAGRGKLLTKNDERYNKFLLFVKTLIWKCVHVHISMHSITHNILPTSLAPSVGLFVNLFHQKCLPFPLITHRDKARIQRNWVIFPRQLVRRIGVDLYYLKQSEFPHSGVLQGSLGLVILELGLPPICAGRGKLLTINGERYNKLQPLDKFRL